MGRLAIGTFLVALTIALYSGSLSACFTLQTYLRTWALEAWWRCLVGLHSQHITMMIIDICITGMLVHVFVKQAYAVEMHIGLPE